MSTEWRHTHTHTLPSRRTASATTTAMLLERKRQDFCKEKGNWTGLSDISKASSSFSFPFFFFFLFFSFIDFYFFLALQRFVLAPKGDDERDEVRDVHQYTGTGCDDRQEPPSEDLPKWPGLMQSGVRRDESDPYPLLSALDSSVLVRYPCRWALAIPGQTVQ